MQVYLDNAATTKLDSEVIEAMLPYMQEHYGNPSSIHGHGRVVRSAIEKARKQVADLLNTSPAEIFFTSGGTEADNTALRCMVRSLSIKNIISTRLEHHAVLHTLDYLQENNNVRVHFVRTNQRGGIDLAHLEELLIKNPNCLVTCMQANNEIGNLSPVHEIGQLCKQYHAYFHSDTVQAMGHYIHDLSEMSFDALVGSAHKFHGPKGVGFLYLNGEHNICPLIYGGAQERNMRGGTENVYGIVGLAKALEIAYRDMVQDRKHIEGLKSHMIELLKQQMPDVQFNGCSADLQNSLYTVLNVSLPCVEDKEMLLFNLDINQISASAGSACSSGSQKGSHVIEAIGGSAAERPAIRFSFSKYNAKEEINYTVERLASFCKVPSTA